MIMNKMNISQEVENITSKMIGDLALENAKLKALLLNAQQYNSMLTSENDDLKSKLAALQEGSEDVEEVAG